MDLEKSLEHFFIIDTCRCGFEQQPPSFYPDTVPPERGPVVTGNDRHGWYPGTGFFRLVPGQVTSLGNGCTHPSTCTCDYGKQQPVPGIWPFCIFFSFPPHDHYPDDTG
jgi:hypothetical protein